MLHPVRVREAVRFCRAACEVDAAGVAGKLAALGAEEVLSLLLLFPPMKTRLSRAFIWKLIWGFFLGGLESASNPADLIDV